jgi:hypothetical protein
MIGRATGRNERCSCDKIVYYCLFFLLRVRKVGTKKSRRNGQLKLPIVHLLFCGYPPIQTQPRSHTGEDGPPTAHQNPHHGHAGNQTPGPHPLIYTITPVQVFLVTHSTMHKGQARFSRYTASSSETGHGTNWTSLPAQSAGMQARRLVRMLTAL